ncbi:MAG TPA: TIM-barrel domain-containing protein [Ignavibacteriaceae bacterium]|nr:TIM-barrel domain-containing protein [Ignavibacteriaceae bacterium]
MIFKRISQLMLFLFFAYTMLSSLSAQVKTIKNGIELNNNDLRFRIIFYDDNIIRVTKCRPGGTFEKLSLSVILDSIPGLNINTEDAPGKVLLKSGKVLAEISKPECRVSFLSINNNPILKETGKPVFKDIIYYSDSGFTVQQDFQISFAEGLYGLGEQTDGYFNYRGKTVTLAQANVGASSSFLISTNNYGILWDNYSKTIFRENKDTASFWSDIGNNIDYYFVAGENMDSVISGYRKLTGKAPMYGKWAYGYWQSKEHYVTQAELMGVARKYRELKIPIDNMIQDWDYWNGPRNWSGMFFDKALFPDPKGMCDELHKKNFHIIISIWPALGPATPIYADMKQHGFLYKPVGWAGFKYYDAFNPEANKLYWKYLKSGIYSKGLDGWWIDSTEPDVVNAMTKESSEYELKKMGRNYLGSWARYLNAFSLSMTNDLYKFWREETSDKRLFILTRSTFSGQQRNAATTWSGDIGASWEVYRKQIAAGVNHCMSGIPYWTFDIGAFVLGAYDGVFMKGGKDPAYQELYARMFQLGAFSPIFRSHGSETPREVWEMGEFTKPITKIDNLRYRLMPYIYSLAWMVTSRDYTIMRGLPMDFPNDENTYPIDDQFMFGPSIMVCPVTDFMYYTPPQASVKITSEFFKTKDNKPGLNAKYYKDAGRKFLSLERIDPDIDIFWYTGRPDYATDSMYAITWEGKLIPKETGKHQFHLISYDPKRIILNGDTLKMVYTSVEQYTETVNLEAGKEYNFILETENRSTGAAKCILNWKTPSIFAKEDEKAVKEKYREVYLPAGNKWYDFWTGESFEGGEKIKADAPIEKIPLFIKAGSIIPMGPFLQYSTEKSADPLELRIYSGADAHFTLYEDENDNYNYEKGIYSTIDFDWNNEQKTLTISERKGEFPGMLKERTFNVVIVSKEKGIGVDVSQPVKAINYTGKEIVETF